MSTRWQFCPQQKGDRQGSPACPSLHSLLLTAACAPRQVINVSVQSLGIMSFTQGYRNMLGYKQKLLLELLRIQAKGFIKSCLSSLKYKLISVVHPGWILREGELSADNYICMGRFFSESLPVLDRDQNYMTWPPYPIEMYKMPNILSPPCELLSNKAQAEIFHRNYSE